MEQTFYPSNNDVQNNSQFNNPEIFEFEILGLKLFIQRMNVNQQAVTMDNNLSIIASQYTSNGIPLNSNYPEIFEFEIPGFKIIIQQMNIIQTTQPKYFSITMMIVFEHLFMINPIL
jgi:hypothetical protein